MEESERIKRAYDKRAKQNQEDLYSYQNPSALFMYQQRESAILKALRENRIEHLSDKNILDIGCGSGGMLRDFINYGAVPENCYGIDLIPERIENAKKLSPGMDFKLENAANTDFEEEYFDIVICSTVFSSVLDSGVKQTIAYEILRILSPRGIIIWYDFHIDNPKNPDVKGVTKKEINQLFSGCDVKLKRITLAPPITRLIAPYSILLCYILEKFIILNTHYLGAIKKRI